MGLWKKSFFATFLNTSYAFGCVVMKVAFGIGDAPFDLEGKLGRVLCNGYGKFDGGGDYKKRCEGGVFGIISSIGGRSFESMFPSLQEVGGSNNSTPSLQCNPPQVE